LFQCRSWPGRRRAASSNRQNVCSALRRTWRLKVGLDIDTSTLIHEWIGVHAITGPLLTLGVQNADFTWAQFCAATSRQCPQHDPRNIPTAQAAFPRPSASISATTKGRISCSI
jgi:hypothetical protein